MQGRMEKANYTISISLVLAMLLAVSLLSCTRSVSVAAETGAVIDLYTDKLPFDGEGINVSSDAFEPQELIALHANVTYNGGPLQKMLVAFQVNGPENPLENISVAGSGNTSENGIADFSFRIPWPGQSPEEAIFGQWIAFASVRIADQVVVDTMPFQVGWIIRVTEISTLNSELKPQSAFVRMETIVFNLTIENIARTEKNATVQVEAKDSSDHPIVLVQMDNVLFKPGKTNLKATSQIPAWAETGLANASAAPFTASPDVGGRLYSPAIYTTFSITTGGDIAIENVVPSSSMVLAGESVTIEVTVLNQGNQTATFDLNVYYNATLIETRQVTELATLTQKTLAFTWNTNSISPGFYQISASAPLSGDPTPSDNTYVDGVVEIRSGPSNVHDVGVVDVIPSPTVVKSGEIVSINVTIKNEGAFTESFHVSAYYGRALIGRTLVQNLAPSIETVIVFKWNTSGVFPLKYVISAASDTVEGETHVSDNSFVDGTVTILPYPPFFPTLDWLIVWAMIILAGIVGMILLLLLLVFDRTHRRRRPSRTYVVIAHPHI